ncbi:MAG: ATPase V [Treponema sp.]|nr:ATPase V [Treponema sp.]
MQYFFIGDQELVTAFNFIGIQGAAVRDADETVSVFRRITESRIPQTGTVLPDALPGASGCKVLIITEEAADWIGQLLVEWQISGRYPLVVEIPGIQGKLPGRKSLVDSIHEAIGIHI